MNSEFVDEVDLCDFILYRWDSTQESADMDDAIKKFLNLLILIYNDSRTDWNIKLIISSSFTYYLLEKEVIPNTSPNGLHDDFYLTLYVTQKIVDYTDIDFVKEHYYHPKQFADDFRFWFDSISHEIEGLEDEIREKVGLDKLPYTDFEFYSKNYSKKVVSFAAKRRRLLAVMAYLLKNEISLPSFHQQRKWKFLLSLGDLNEILRIIAFSQYERKQMNYCKKDGKSKQDIERIQNLNKKYGTIFNIVLQKSKKFYDTSVVYLFLPKILKLSLNILNDDKCDWWTKLFVSSSISSPILSVKSDISEEQKLYNLCFVLHYAIKYISEEISSEIIQNNWQFQEDPFDVIAQLTTCFNTEDPFTALRYFHELGFIKFLSVGDLLFNDTYYSQISRLGSENKQLFKTIYFLLHQKYNISLKSGLEDELMNYVYKFEEYDAIEEFIRLSTIWHNFTIKEDLLEEENIPKRDGAPYQQSARVKFLLRQQKKSNC
jgi:hypothetical protein